MENRLCDNLNKQKHVNIITSQLTNKLAPNKKVHGANMGITWALSAPDGPHVRPMNLVTIIATLRWASCGPGTGLQAHPLKSHYRFASSQEI